jgi:hypothetical protein
MQYPGLGVTVDSAPAEALVDVWFMFGLEVAWIVLHLVIVIPGLVLARRALHMERRPVGQ